jgi:hypothetical protein
MKGDPIKPRPLVEGICFLCLNPCKGYLHQECALSASDEKQKRRDEARELEKLQ